MTYKDFELEMAFSTTKWKTNPTNSNPICCSNASKWYEVGIVQNSPIASNNEAALSIGRYSFSFDKAYTRNVIRKYEPPSAYDSVKSAMDYLTWKDIKKGSE
jgi:hypothetical protein